MENVAQDIDDEGPNADVINSELDVIISESDVLNSESTQTLSRHPSGSTENSSSFETDTKTVNELTPEFQSPVPESPDLLAPEANVDQFASPQSSTPEHHDNTDNSCLDDNTDNSCQGNSTSDDQDTTLLLSEQEISDVNKIAGERVTTEDALFTPPKRSDASHFADAFHCPPTRSCIFYDALLSCLEVSKNISYIVHLPKL